ncbi:hypothetical protein B0A55_00330 [Friedmanniomyces simplex]|uniref:Uncharacterized protein n=1 Tax=Friedmanniomyces simplex TaxID=329884 RepID=A0A4U0Y3P6_9PEZI|nr:hypothetical protein B0A55_00330 [Friedmanniomyces simplex]
MYNNCNGANHDDRPGRLLEDLKAFIDTNRSVDENAIHQYLSSMHDPLQDSTYRSIWRDAVGYAYDSITHLQQRQNAYYVRARGLAHDSWQTPRGEELTRFVQDPHPRDEHGQRVRVAEVPMFDAVALDDEMMLTVTALRARLVLLLRAIAIKSVMCEGLSKVITEYLNPPSVVESVADGQGYRQGRGQGDMLPAQTPSSSSRTFGDMQPREAAARYGEKGQEYRIRGAGGESGAPWKRSSPSVHSGRLAQQSSMTPAGRVSPNFRGGGAGVPLPPSGPMGRQRRRW